MDRTTVKLFNWNTVFDFQAICYDDLHLNELLMSPYVHRQDYIKIIDHLGRVQTSRATHETLEDKNLVVKIECLEKLSDKFHSTCRSLAIALKHDGPTTAHLFVSPKDGISFDMHTDPDDVIVYTVQGCKEMELENYGVISIPEGWALFMPKNHPHRAINSEASITISFGLEGFILDKLYHA